jgi:hypothetical protein
VRCATSSWSRRTRMSSTKYSRSDDAVACCRHLPRHWRRP